MLQVYTSDTPTNQCNYFLHAVITHYKGKGQVAPPTYTSHLFYLLHLELSFNIHIQSMNAL